MPESLFLGYAYDLKKKIGMPFRQFLAYADGQKGNPCQRKDAIRNLLPSLALEATSPHFKAESESQTVYNEPMISRIEGPSSIRTTAPVRRTGKASRTSETSFSEHLDETEGAGAAQGANPLGAVTNVLDIQEVDDALARAARGKIRAEDLLNKLDDLRLDLLTGGLSKNKLLRLSEVVNSRRPEIEDPRLNEILDEIDLRAQVELAKFTRA